MDCETNCIQKLNIWLLKKDNKNMALDIKDIKSDIKDIKSWMDEIKQFVLTSPQKFPDRKDFYDFKNNTEKFQNNINLKITFASWIFAVILYLLDKFI